MGNHEPWKTWSKLNVIFYNRTSYVLMFLAAKPSLDIERMLTAKILLKKEIKRQNVLKEIFNV